MKLMNKDKIGRRETLRSGGRFLAFGCLAWIGGLTVRKKERPERRETCGPSYPCQSCGQSERCSLPPALSFRQKKNERNHG